MGKIKAKWNLSLVSVCFSTFLLRNFPSIVALITLVLAKFSPLIPLALFAHCSHYKFFGLLIHRNAKSSNSNRTLINHLNAVFWALLNGNFNAVFVLSDLLTVWAAFRIKSVYFDSIWKGLCFDYKCTQVISQNFGFCMSVCKLNSKEILLLINRQ